VPGLHEARLLADELFLIAHDDVSGKPRLQSRATGLGLAGALLGELMLYRRISASGGSLVITDHRPPGDALAHTVLDYLTGEAQTHSLNTWLAFLAHLAPDRVAERLARDGLVTRVESRAPWRSARWVPADMTVGFAPLARVRSALSDVRPMTTADVLLAGLAAASGLEAFLLWNTGPPARQYLDHSVSVLPDPLQELIAATGAAVGNAVLSHRV
jgi:hypothetical protein